MPRLCELLNAFGYRALRPYPSWFGAAPTAREGVNPPPPSWSPPSSSREDKHGEGTSTGTAATRLEDRIASVRRCTRHNAEDSGRDEPLIAFWLAEQRAGVTR